MASSFGRAPRYHVSRLSRQKSYLWLKRRAGLLPLKLGFGAVLSAGKN
jgi:hypothetical protein